MAADRRRDRLVERVAAGVLALDARGRLRPERRRLPERLRRLSPGRRRSAGWRARREVAAGGGVIYAGALVVSLGLLRASPSYGLPAVLWLFAVVWGTDVAAYFAGRLIGGPKLWPSVSPGKTWSGAIAGAFAGAALGLLLSGWAERIDRLFWLGLATAVVSELGDLFEFGVQAAVRRQGFEPPHSRPRRPDGQARRLHCGLRLRRAFRRRPIPGAPSSPADFFNGERAKRRGAPSRRKSPRGPSGSPSSERPGSIGRSCAQVIGASPGRFTVASVASGRDGAALGSPRPRT